MTRYGVDACTECGEMSELLLAPRFPHICSRCLFPPSNPEDPRADFIGLTPAMTLADRIASFKGTGHFHGTTEAFGKNVPESYSRGKRE